MRRGVKIPRKCPINFDFSLDRIECKLCKHFEVCIEVYNKARKLANNVQ